MCHMNCAKEIYGCISIRIRRHSSHGKVPRMVNVPGSSEILITQDT